LEKLCKKWGERTGNKFTNSAGGGRDSWGGGNSCDPSATALKGGKKGGEKNTGYLAQKIPHV